MKTKNVAPRRLTTRVEDLQEQLVHKTGTGPNASVYSRNECVNFFCVEGKGYGLVVYTEVELDLAISGLLEDGRWHDYGDLFGPKRPKPVEEPIFYPPGHY